MFMFLSENLGTVVTALIVACIVSAIIINIVRDKQKGRSSCGCDCANCPKVSGRCKS